MDITAVSCYVTEVPLVCQRGVSQLRNTLRNEAIAAKIEDLTLWGFRSCEMELLCCEMVHECQEVVSQRRVLGCEIYFAAEGHFRSQTLISQRPCKGCEMISQQMAFFAGAYFGLRNFANH